MTVKYQTGDIEINVARKWNRDGNLVESYEFVNTGEKDADLHPGKFPSSHKIHTESVRTDARS